MTQARARCSAHDLATGPDGLCALCRRASEVPAAPNAPEPGTADGGLETLAPGGGSMRMVALGLAFVIAVGTGMALGTLGEDAQQPTAASTAPTVAEPAPEDDAERRGATRPVRDEEAELERARSEVEVELFSTSWCPHCVRARAFLSREGIRYREYDVEADRDALARMRALHPSGGVPFLLVDGTDHVGGFGEGAYRNAIDGAARRRLSRGR